MILIRPALFADMPAAADIYNDAVAHTTGTFDVQLKSQAEMEAWYRRHSVTHPVLVTEENGIVVAWAAMSPWSERGAYARTVEISVYVSAAERRRGLGGALLDELLRRGRAAGVRQAVAQITQGNDVSLRMHSLRGFVEVGRLRRVGEKFGRVLDVHLLQMSLENVVGN